MSEKEQTKKILEQAAFEEKKKSTRLSRTWSENFFLNFVNFCSFTNIEPQCLTPKKPIRGGYSFGNPQQEDSTSICFRRK